MNKEYSSYVVNGLIRTAKLQKATINQSDIQNLPETVKKYLSVTGFLAKEKINNFRVVCEGRIRGNSGGWMKFSSKQYNFFDEPSRFFLIKATKMGIPARGLHVYKNLQASMVIKMANIFKVVDARGPKMNQAETVTLFNDMCVMAPGTLISDKVEWEEIGDLKIKSTFTNGNYKIAAILHFNENGELTNFISNDRYDTDGKTYVNYPWSTPLSDYKDFGGIRIASRASLIYHKPEGDFCYGKFILKEADYNCKELY